MRFSETQKILTSIREDLNRTYPQPIKNKNYEIASLVNNADRLLITIINTFKLLKELKGENDD